MYDQMMGIDPIHPLAELALHQPTWGRSFYASEYADFLGLQTEQAEMILVGLTNVGYVDLDLATGFVKSNPAPSNTCCAKKALETTTCWRSIPGRGHGVRHAEPEQPSHVPQGHRPNRGERGPGRQIVPDGGEIAWVKTAISRSQAW